MCYNKLIYKNMGGKNNKSNKSDLKTALQDIDRIYNETIMKLDELHRRKLELIKEYKKRSDSDILSRIRRFFN